MQKSFYFHHSGVHTSTDCNIWWALLDFSLKALTCLLFLLSPDVFSRALNYLNFKPLNRGTVVNVPQACHLSLRGSVQLVHLPNIHSIILPTLFPMMQQSSAGFCLQPNTRNTSWTSLQSIAGLTEPCTIITAIYCQTLFFTGTVQRFPLLNTNLDLEK